MTITYYKILVGERKIPLAHSFKSREDAEQAIKWACNVQKEFPDMKLTFMHGNPKIEIVEVTETARADRCYNF